MKHFLVLSLMLAFFGIAPAHAAGSGQIGLYVGGKLGTSMESTENRFGLKQGEESFPAPFGNMTWGRQEFAMGDYKDTVLGGGVTLGYDFHPRFNVPIRAELDYTLRGKASDTKQGDLLFSYSSSIMGDFSGITSVRMKSSLTLQTIMLNAWWDIPTGTPFTPYVGGGIGVAFGRLSSSSVDVDAGDILTARDNFTRFAWSLGGGISYDFNDNWTLDLGYRYINAGNHEMTYDNDANYMKVKNIVSHDIMLGLRYTF